MRGLLVGLILGLLIVPLAFFFYAINGKAPVAVSDSPMPFENFIAHGALHSRIKKEAPERDMNSFTPGDLASGVAVYRANCAFCHGLPLQSPSAASQGMFPRPPQLFNEKEMVTDDPVGVTYWKVKNGIRLSGMPGFEKTLNDQQLWQVSALMTRADKLPPDVLRGLLPALGPGDVQMISGAPAAAAPVSPPAPAAPPASPAPNPSLPQ